ncbi:MAG TPA: alpha-amylase family glycosyl hydrolase [Bacteroidota bacterium]|nr:alpha-amylase family glycosyl hydrolase [Bacteroidota bacterium]
MRRYPLIAVMIAVSAGAAIAQDSIDVTFRYTNLTASAVNLVGDFEGWSNSNPAYAMANIGGLWVKTARLPVGGIPTGTLHGSWQYKFYPAGTAGAWPADPLNPHQNAADQGNSFIWAKDPAIYLLLPNQLLPVQTTATPTLSSYIFPKVGTTVDTSSIRLIVDGTAIGGLGPNFDPVAHKLSYTLQTPLANGMHTLIIQASSLAGGSNGDTVTFRTQSGFVQISNPGGYATLTTQRTLYGLVQGMSVTQVSIVRNNADTTTATVSAGKFTAVVPLAEGVNTFRALADSSGTQVSSTPVSFTRIVNHRPNALISFHDNGSIDLQATGSTSPDSGRALRFIWGEDPSNPSVIGGINGNTSPVITVARPSVQGEYYFSLVATDTSGNSDTTRNYFTLYATPPIGLTTVASVPRWVREGRMYTMFFKMHTAAGTINAALPDLHRIASMGYNILWILPVMKNRDPINNGPGPGYNITDFYTVAPEYGTNQDMANFVAQAHALGMKVILDVTPNHTSSSHPFVLDARSYREASRYWTYYQHAVLGQGNLSQSVTSDGFVYYNGFSDALLNYNWADPDARAYMIDVYRYWIQAIGVDGYRFDVYWGPHSRANLGAGGEGEMGVPVRAALKHIRPDIALLGETAGTGTGTEVNYADQGGGLDEAYDWNLMGTVESNIWGQTPGNRVNTLDASLRNGAAGPGMGYVPGQNSFFLRFLENQDQDRIAYLYGAGAPDAATARARTMPVATAVNLAVGLPEVYAGQEIGRGPGIADFDVRRRGVLDFTDPAGLILMPHYQKLAQIKKQYPCFSTQTMVRVGTDVSGVYAYSRPYAGLNALVVTNIDEVPHTANVIMFSAAVPAQFVGLSDGTPYVATDLYNNNATRQVLFTGGVDTLNVSLPAYGSAVYVIDNVAHTLVLPSLTSIAQGGTPGVPRHFALEQNYPNPFNPATTITYEIRTAGEVTLKVYDLLGREVATLANGYQSAGTYTASFDASRLSSGVYFYRLQSGSFVNTKKMVLAK